MNDPLAPLPEPDPLDDPMLDALENSIENPPGLTDPLASPDEPLMDNLGRQLGALESHIENTPPMLPPDIAPNTSDPISGGVGPTVSEPRLPEEISPMPEPTTETFGSFDTSPPPPPQDSHHRLHPPNPPGLPTPRPGRGSTRRGSFPTRRHTPHHPKPIRQRPGQIRYCPDTREMIDKQQCENCEKYRHWPEGTTEGPRQCWHDWQQFEQHKEPDDDSEKD